ncbi:hypothetical protein O0L34_g17887 [Tuta absoluta]|nr:hypothetical protein O0L34_g17887 [Tuta absoluta]
MKTSVVLAAILTIASVKSENLTLGETHCNHVIYLQKIKFVGIPFVRRDTDIFFNSKYNEKISRIEAIEKHPTKATAIITAGGLGQGYVNIHLKSERGSGLYYKITIYS